MRKYLHYIGPALWTWARGIRWLWTRRKVGHYVGRGGVDIYANGATSAPGTYGITYKPGWGPWKFLPVYLFDYGLAVLLGYGCVSLSRAKRLFGKSHWSMTGPRLWGVEGIR